VSTAAGAGRVPNVRIGVDVDPAVFFDQFFDRIGPFARRLGCDAYTHNRRTGPSGDRPARALRPVAQPRRQASHQK
jgi:hypothetical protein